MKKKFLGLCFLSVLCLSYTTSVLADENQVIGSEQTVESSSTVSSVDKTSQEVTQSTENVENEQTTESTGSEEETAVPETQVETAEGTMSLPRGRSDLYPSIQLFASLPSVSATNTNTPSKSFIDISSHNGNISVANFQK